jgi:hypothetical protein
MKRFILHIGHGKCASSTLQTFLSLHPVLDLATPSGGVLRYVAVQPDGGVLHGEALTDFAARVPLRYANSCSEFVSVPELHSYAIDQIMRICGPNDTVITSCENWANQGFVTKEVGRVVAGLPIEADIFMLTRPPVDWVNAAWWQWGVRYAQDRARSLTEFRLVDFTSSLNQWRSLDNIGRTGVFDISQGPIACLLNFAGAKISVPTEFESVNVASDYDLLRHLMRNKTIYQRSDTDPTVEFRLNLLAKFERKPLPFVVTRSAAHEMIIRDRTKNEALLGLIEEDAAPLAEGVRRKYIDKTAYDHLTDDFPLSDFDADYSDQFILKLISTILSLGEEIDLSKNLQRVLENFDPNVYLKLNPDVREGGTNPFEHFMRYGAREGRRVR